MCLCQLSTECDRCVLHTSAHKHAKQETDEPVLLRHQDLQGGDWSAASPESFLITRSGRWREGKPILYIRKLSHCYGLVVSPKIHMVEI